MKEWNKKKWNRREKLFSFISLYDFTQFPLSIIHFFWKSSPRSKLPKDTVAWQPAAFVTTKISQRLLRNILLRFQEHSWSLRRCRIQNVQSAQHSDSSKISSCLLQKKPSKNNSRCREEKRKAQNCRTFWFAEPGKANRKKKTNLVLDKSKMWRREGKKTCKRQICILQKQNNWIVALL